jgi:hypothetical protein
MLTPEIKYDIAVEGNGRSLLIDWGNTRNWAKTYHEQLENADRISLIPKKGKHLSVVTVVLGEGKRWIVFSRIFGKTGTPKRRRVYAIGYQQTVKGVNIKHLTWVYPNGTIESANEPSYANLL